MNLRTLILAILMLTIASVCAMASDNVEVLRTPNGGIQPQAVVDDRGTLHLVYFKADKHTHRGPKGVGNLFYVTKAQGKSEWSTPIHVNSEPGSARRNSAINHAQIAMGENGRVHVVWFNMRPPKYWYTRLKDDGSAFESQRNLVSEYNKGVEAGASVVTDGKGNVFVVWHAGDFHHEEQRAVYMTHSNDGGVNFSQEQRVNPDDTGVCACCGLSALADSQGTLYISYRAARKMVHRDMTLLESTDGGQRFSGRTIHKWRLNSCPVTTTTIASGPDGKAMVTWETRGQVFFANVDNLFKAVPAPGISTHQKNSTIAINKAGETLLVWGDGAGWQSGGKLHWRIFDSNGKAARRKGQSARRIPEFSVAEAVAMPDGQFVVIF